MLCGLCPIILTFSCNNAAQSELVLDLLHPGVMHCITRQIDVPLIDVAFGRWSHMQLCSNRYLRRMTLAEVCT